MWEQTKNPTCTASGEETHYCSRCDEYETREVKPLGHNYTATVTPPSCTEKGYTTHTCSRCEDTYTDTYVDSLGHDFGEWVTLREATDLADGERLRSCKRCSAEEREPIPAKHTPYTVRFVDHDGSVLSEKVYQYGDEVETPPDPVRPPDREYFYTFAGWDKEITAVRGDAVYTATYGAASRLRRVSAAYENVNSGDPGNVCLLIPPEGEGAALGELVSVTVPAAYISGDVDGDGKISAKDYAMVKRAVIGSFKLTPAQFERADVNGNGRTDAGDYAMVKRHVLGTYVIRPLPPTVIAGSDYSGYTVAVVTDGAVSAVFDGPGAKSGVTIPAGGFAIAFSASALSSDAELAAALSVSSVTRVSASFADGVFTAEYIAQTP